MLDSLCFSILRMVIDVFILHSSKRLLDQACSNFQGATKVKYFWLGFQACWTLHKRFYVIYLLLDLLLSMNNLMLSITIDKSFFIRWSFIHRGLIIRWSFHSSMAIYPLKLLPIDGYSFESCLCFLLYWPSRKPIILHFTYFNFVP